MRWVVPTELQTEEPFRSLFPVNPAVLEAIKESLRSETGFDGSKPIDIWAGRGVVVDGHTRLRAALEVCTPKVAIYEHDFIDDEAALAYAIGNQRNRRNLTDAEMVRCMEALDKRKRAGRPAEKLAPDGANFDSEQSQEKTATGKSSIEIAKMLGSSPRKVERIRTVLDHADEETKEAVRSGETTVNQAYQETQERRRGGEAKPKKEKNKADFGDLLRMAIDVYCNDLRQGADKETIARGERAVLEYVREWWCSCTGFDISSLSPAKEEVQPLNLSREEVLAWIEELRGELSGANKGTKLAAAIVKRLNEERIPTLNGISKWNIGFYYQFLKEAAPIVVEEKV